MSVCIISCVSARVGTNPTVYFDVNSKRPECKMPWRRRGDERKGVSISVNYVTNVSMSQVYRKQHKCTTLIFFTCHSLNWPDANKFRNYSAVLLVSGKGVANKSLISSDCPSVAGNHKNIQKCQIMAFSAIGRLMRFNQTEAPIIL